MGGYGLLTVNDLLTEIGFVLIENPVNTVLGTAVPVGQATITPPSMDGIYLGAMLLAGSGDSLEVITVSGVTATTFTANFANAHPSTDSLVGATFPSGQTDNPLFTQEEMLDYVADTQNEFLLKVEQAVYNIAPIGFSAQVRIYTAPSDSMRVERISIAGSQLYPVSQTSLDMSDDTWQAETRNVPRAFYTDKINTQQFGYSPVPTTAGSANLWYSQRGSTTLGLRDGFLIPDPLVYILKYGVLAKVYGKEGEMRDSLKEKYCAQRYELGIKIVRKMLMGHPGLERKSSANA